ncbi:hypothetical protein MLD38_002726 [Melastoma candidum]|uniref:Uncharacterized protein n=1 Tax=Melastoma candidum TaxID=119954 RepID=A0ACB9RZY9_9MYRT|nr:hypothetical protein MLD38_002726 [Melastoma candidum]
MSRQSKSVVVIDDASKDVSLSGILGVLHRASLIDDDLQLKPGDKLVLLGVLHRFINPMGYKSNVDCSSIFGPNDKIINEALARKKEEYMNNEELSKIQMDCNSAKIKFIIDVQVSASLKLAVLKAAKDFKATWVILDRQMKKDKNFLMEKLHCGIARAKRNNLVERIKSPNTAGNSDTTSGRSLAHCRDSPGNVSHGELLPGSSEEESCHKRKSGSRKNEKKKDNEGSAKPPSGKSPFHESSSSEQLLTTTTSTSSLGNTEPFCSTEAKSSPLPYPDEETTTNTELETAGEQSPPFMGDIKEEDQTSDYCHLSPEDSRMQENKTNTKSHEPCYKGMSFKNSYCSICRNRRPKVGWKRDFTYAELQAATEGFSPKNFLSEGGFGSVYRGEMNRQKIAVKQHNWASSQGEKEFKSEVNVLSKARHENLVMLLGSCSEGDHRLLVYEFVCNGSLDQHLSKHARRPLSWEKRMRIAVGAAKGLQYLHKQNIIHRDMRPNNILVTHDYEAMLGDFGLAKTKQEDSDFSSDTSVVGTLGYLAPEYVEWGKVSTKTDVYSFGVVLLQLITGLKTTDKVLGGKSLVGWARPLLKERNYPDLVDPRIMDSHDVLQLFWMVRVAERCLSKDPLKRLTMEQVVDALNCIIEGNTVCCIRDSSPVRSDSICSMPDSIDYHYEDFWNLYQQKAASMNNQASTSGKLVPSPPSEVVHSGESNEPLPEQHGGTPTPEAVVGSTKSMSPMQRKTTVVDEKNDV